MQPRLAFGEIMHFCSFWHGSSIGPLEKTSLLSFVQKGFETVLFSYEKIEGVPLGINVRSADEILPRDAVFENPREPGSFAGFSNIFRYHLLSKKKATWFDLDVIQYDWPENEQLSTLAGFEDDDGGVNGAILRIPQNSPLLNYLLVESSSFNITNLRWGDLGPRLLSQAVSWLSLEKAVMPRTVFYEIGPLETWRLFDPAEKDDLQRRLQGSWSIHLWARVLLRTAPELQRYSAPEGSLFSELQARHETQTQLPPLPKEFAKTLRKRQETYQSLSNRMLRRAENLFANRNRLK